MAKALIEDAKKLGELSRDCSPILSHLIRCNTEPPRSSDEAREILKAILGLSGSADEVCLRARPVGWYSSCTGLFNVFDHESSKFMAVDETRAVCFTNSTLKGLSGHRDVFKAEYGLAFARDVLYKRGASPCLDIRSDLLKQEVHWNQEKYMRHVYNFVPKPLLPFVNIINGTFDATHEREWRIANDLTSEYSDLCYVFCPESDFSLFSKVQSEEKPTLLDLSTL